MVGFIVLWGLFMLLIDRAAKDMTEKGVQHAAKGRMRDSNPQPLHRGHDTSGDPIQVFPLPKFSLTWEHYLHPFPTSWHDMVGTNGCIISSSFFSCFM